MCSTSFFYTTIHPLRSLTHMFVNWDLSIHIKLCDLYCRQYVTFVRWSQLCSKCSLCLWFFFFSSGSLLIFCVHWHFVYETGTCFCTFISQNIIDAALHLCWQWCSQTRLSCSFHSDKRSFLMNTEHRSSRQLNFDYVYVTMTIKVQWPHE